MEKGPEGMVASGMYDGGTSEAYKSCIVWVPRGRAAACSEVIHSEQQPVGEIARQKKTLPSFDRSTCDELDMESYDMEDEAGTIGLTKEELEIAMQTDPNLKNEDDSEDELEADADRIRASDFLLIVGSTSKGDSSFETYVYDHSDMALYVHHDTMMNFLPLSIDNIDRYRQTEGRHLLAVATYAPIIEIWDNDDYDGLEPIDYLGRDSKHCHKDAVTCLRSNRITPAVLASASADHTVRIWDLIEGKAAEKMNLHSDVISALQWHPYESTIIATCGQDSLLKVADIRLPAKEAAVVQFESKIEGLSWNRHNPFVMLGATSNGQFVGLDVRNISTEKPFLWNIQVSTEDLTDVTDTQVGGMVVTCGITGDATVWDVRGALPVSVHKKALQAGTLFCVEACEDSECRSVLAFAGRELVIWDTTDTECIKQRFTL